MFERLREDVQCVFERDPAARSRVEVLTTYPGVHAIVLYRLAHRLWLRRWSDLFDVDERKELDEELTASRQQLRALASDDVAGLVAGQLLSDRAGENLQIYNRGISGNKVPDLAARWQQDAVIPLPEFAYLPKPNTFSR